MSTWRLILQSVWHYRQTQLVAIIGATVGAAVLCGALIIGDCVRYTLRQAALQRIGETELALVGNDRFFRAALADDLQNKLQTDFTSILLTPGIVAAPDGSARANQTQIVGVDDQFTAFWNSTEPLLSLEEGEAAINATLAEQLNAEQGDNVIIRVEKPSALPRDMPLASDEDTTVALRVTVKQILPAADIGRFSLRAEQVVPMTAFLSRDWLSEQLAVPGKANVIFARQSDVTAQAAQDALQETMTLEDVNLSFEQVADEQQQIETGRVFLEQPIIDAIESSFDVQERYLTYFVNDLNVGEKHTPYSMVTAIGSELAADEMVITRWLADDLEAKVGDELKMRYFVIGPDRKLIERDTTFTIKRIIEMDDPAADPKLMPAFPGLADQENCRDWTPGIPIDLDQIRDKDEDYWDEYRGTPKALISLAAGQQLWENRFGKLTAMRVAGEDIEPARLLDRIDAKSVGLFFEDIRTPALNAPNNALDFGQLFLGLSFFLIIAAVLLTAMGFVFSIEQRSHQVGTLLAMGFTPGKVMGMLLSEGAALAVVGSGLGMFLGQLYTKAILVTLNDAWSGAVAATSISFHVTGQTLAIGFIASALTAIFAMWLAVRGLVKRPVTSLLNLGSQQTAPLARGGLKGMVVAITCALCALAMFVFMDVKQQAAGAFFGIGGLLLIASFGRCYWFFSVKQTGKTMSRLGQLASRNTARRRGRSLATVAMIAAGCFMTTAVGINRNDPTANIEQRSSGSGGFVFYGSTILPVFDDINAPDVRDKLGLTGGPLDETSFVMMRKREGDDASCLNLNRAVAPQLLGVRTQELNLRNSFKFIAKHESAAPDARWDMLDMTFEDGSIPAVGDDATVTWALGKGIDGIVEYTDEFGRTVKLRIVGKVSNSILQGSLIIGEPNFEKLFPSESGHHILLVDCPRDAQEEVREELSIAMEDFGLSLTPTGERLTQFSTVESTYLKIFQVLGGLGLVLGTAGLGLVVLRNLLDRKAELAMLWAVGYDAATLRKLAILEHVLLLIFGLIAGTVCALIAVQPALSHDVDATALWTTALTVLAMAVLGLLWVYVSSYLATRGKQIDALAELG